MVDDKGKQGGGGRRLGTPAPGVPVRPVPPPRPPREDETPVVSIELHRRQVAPTSGGSEASPAERDDTVDRLAVALAKRLEGGTGGGGNRPIRRPAIFRAEWLRFLLAWVAALAIAAAGFYLKIHDDMRDRPTQADVVRMMSEGINLHETRGEHPKLEQRLDGIEAKQGAMRDEQLHQGDQLDTIARSVGAIEKRLGR